MHASEPASFLGGKRQSGGHSTTGLAIKFSENVVVARSKLSNERSFILLLSEEGFTSFFINNRTNFFDEKKVK